MAKPVATLESVRTRVSEIFGAAEAARLLKSKLPFWWPKKSAITDFLAAREYQKLLDLLDGLEDLSHSGMPRSGHPTLPPARLARLLKDHPEITGGAPYEIIAHCQRKSDVGETNELWLIARKDGVVWEVGGEVAEGAGELVDIYLLSRVGAELVAPYAHWLALWDELLGIWQRDEPGREPGLIRGDIEGAWRELVSHIPPAEIAPGVDLENLGKQPPI